MARIVLLAALVGCGEGTEGPQGPAGATGPAGPAGPAGADGEDGSNGVAGPAGPAGPAGADGEDGEDGDGGGVGGESHTIVFEEVPFPATDSEKREVLAPSSVWIDGVEVPTGYNSFARSGDVIGGNTFGLIVDETGSGIVAADGSLFVAKTADFSSLLDVSGQLYAVTHFESNPGAMYLTELDQDPTTGMLTAVSTEPVDFSGVGGVWIPCAGSVTPWGTHTGSEEYPPDARLLDEAVDIDGVDFASLEMVTYFGLDTTTDTDGDGTIDLTLAEFEAAFNPYNYGYVNEVAVDAAGTTAAKHYAMGRVAVELAYVLPDERTVYITDDGTNVGLFLFVADVAGDLGAGNLYAMKWYQTSGVGAGAADLDWIPLGHATNAEVAALITSNITFSDIFDDAAPIVDGLGVESSCPIGYTPVNVGDPLTECLSLVPGMELAASRLETRRYAAYVGATVELRKEEGIAYDPRTNTLFVAMSAIERGMEDFGKSGVFNATYDTMGPNDIRVEYNTCGAVYALDLAWNGTVGTDYVAENMYAVVEGVPVDYAVGSPFEFNNCSISGIANPDNLTFLDGYDTLIIGEDSTDGHQNDVLWAYDFATGRLDRVQTTPYGAETTSPYWYPDLNGHAYLMSVVQHPYGETDLLQLMDPATAEAYVGFLGPFPVLGD
jgi:secreted PhoX family phosphatase